MPSRPARQCPGRGPYVNRCPNLAKGNEHYCHICGEYANRELKHRNKAYNNNRDQSQTRRFIHSPQWRKIRLIKMTQDYLCEICSQPDREIFAILVHHKDNNELNNNPDNLQSLCNDCHESLHKHDRWGRK